MKAVRTLLVLAVVVAIVALAGYLLTKGKTASTSENSQTVPPVTTQQTPSAGGVTFGKTVSREIVVEASEYKFNPSEVRVKKGETVKITLKNSGRMQHDWFVENLPGANIDLTNAGSTNNIIFTPSQKGTYTTFCSVGTHRQMGMVGKLIVE